MIDLFHADGRAALERLARQRTLYAFDFDGTLAPIVERPDDAVAPASTVALLSRLAATGLPTAIVTGRSVADVRRRCPFAATYVVGNHGAEGVPGAADRSVDDAHRRVALGWLTQWPAAIGPDAAPGIVVEGKDYSVSIHYRQAPDQDAARAAIAAAASRLVPAPRVIGGKCVFNLLPEGAPDKGRALRALARLAHCEATFFIGDDLTDEVAFEGAPASWITVRVGCDVESAAAYCIAEQAEIDRGLEALVVAIESAAWPRASEHPTDDHRDAGEGLPGR